MLFLLRGEAWFLFWRRQIRSVATQGVRGERPPCMAKPGSFFGTDKKGTGLHSPVPIPTKYLLIKQTIAFYFQLV
jgi:hypothetical protein